MNLSLLKWGSFFIMSVKRKLECSLFVSELIDHITASDPVRRQNEYCSIPDKTLS